jgi:hypothetical protein
MKRKMFMKTIMIAGILLFIASPVIAIDPIPQESGFSGFIRLGGGVINYKGNMIKGNSLLDISSNQTKSLTERADSKTSGVVLLPFELAYTFGSTRTQLFLGQSLEDLARFDMASQAGVRQELADAGTVAASFVFNMVITEVWKDPYVVDQDRLGTDQESMGGASCLG